MKIRTLLPSLKDESGSSLLEFAFSFMAFALALFGVFGAAFALYLDHYVGQVAHDGARYAMVRGASWSGVSCATPQTLQCDATAANITSYLKAISPAGFPVQKLAVLTTWPGTTASGAGCDTTQGINSPQCTVKVQVSYSFALPVPFLSKRALTVASSSQVVIAQ